MGRSLRPSALVRAGVREIAGPDGSPFIFPDEDGAQRHIESALYGAEYPPVFPGEFIADTIIDIGAHAGAAARHFRATYRNARIVAFEPNPFAFAFLQANLKDDPKTELVMAALGSFSGKATLFEGRSSSMQDSLLHNEENVDEQLEVDCLHAGHALSAREIDQISILKVDTEGSELQILKALESYLPRTKAIYLEFHSEQHRLMFDQMLKDGFVLFHATVSRPDRGTVGYIAKNALAELQTMTKRSRHVFPKPLTI